MLKRIVFSVVFLCLFTSLSNIVFATSGGGSCLTSTAKILPMAGGGSQQGPDPNINSISGTIADGNTVEINGEYFGSHSLNIVSTIGLSGMIETLDDSTGAGSWGAGWHVGPSSSATPAHISSERAHSGSKSIKSWVDYDIPGSWNSGYLYEPGEEFNEIYATWWTYFDPISDDGSCTPTGSQWKMWRLNATTDRNLAFNNFLGEIMSSGNWLVGGGRTDLYTMIWCAPVGNWCCTGQGCTPPTEPCYPWCYPGSTPYERYASRWHDVSYLDDANKWVRWEVYLKSSSATEAKNGSYIYICNSPFDFRWEIDWGDSVCTHRELEEYPGVSTWLAWTRICWQNYWGNCGDDMEVFNDDIYLQFGNYARIELGDASVYENCNILEIQEPTSWSTDSIEFKLNYGSFKENDYVYVYLHRNDKRLSNGYLIQL